MSSSSSAKHVVGKTTKEEEDLNPNLAPISARRTEGIDGEDLGDIAIDDDDEDDVDDENEEESPFRDPPEGHVRLRPSCISQLPPTVFVEYPPELKMKRNDISEVQPLGSRKLAYKSHWERICIRNAFKRAGFNKGGKYWTAIWSKHQNQSQLQDLHCLQRVNHFPASWCVGRKDRLSRTMMTMKRLHGKEFDYHPDTFVMPNDRDAFQRIVKAELAQEASSSSKKHKKCSQGFWIVKPVASSCGRGISVMNTSQAWATAEKKKVLIQRYLTKPYLINKKKFDLRIYILVTGVDPLRVYVHEEGLTRISTSDYSLNNIHNRFAHLTNYSVNKKADVFKAAAYEPSTTSSDQVTAASSTDADDTAADDYLDPAEMEGYKWSLKAFRKWLTQKEGKEKMEETFQKIYDICLKTMIAAEGEITPHLQRSVSYRTNCFELFGCDVILDEKLNPHLLEVNVSPSLMGSSPLDKRIKGMMIADVLHTVGMFTYDANLIKKYCFQYLDPQDLTSPVSSSTSSKKSSTSEVEPPQLGGNPFAFTNLTKVMSNQDAYRRNACPASIDFNALRQVEENSAEYCSWWQMMLMVEDEIARSKSSGFKILHPTPQNASHYTSLFRNPRFSDHVLARWVEIGGSKGLGFQYLPQQVRMQLPAPVIKKDGSKPPRPKSALPSRPGTANGDRPQDSARRPTSAMRYRHGSFTTSQKESNQQLDVVHVSMSPTVPKEQNLTPWSSLEVDSPQRRQYNYSSLQAYHQGTQTKRNDMEHVDEVVDRILNSPTNLNESNIIPSAPTLPPSAPSPSRKNKSFSESIMQEVDGKPSISSLSLRDETSQLIGKVYHVNPNQNTRNYTFQATQPIAMSPRKEPSCGGLLPHPSSAAQSLALPKVPSQSSNSPSNKIAAMRAMAASVNGAMMLSKPNATATTAAIMQNQQMVALLPNRRVVYNIGGGLDPKSVKR